MTKWFQSLTLHLPGCSAPTRLQGKAPKLPPQPPQETFPNVLTDVDWCLLLSRHSRQIPHLRQEGIKLPCCTWDDLTAPGPQAYCCVKADTQNCCQAACQLHGSALPWAVCGWIAFLLDSQTIVSWKKPVRTHVHGIVFVRGERGKPARKAPFISGIINSLNRHSQGVQHQVSMNSTSTKQSSMSHMTGSARAGKLRSIYLYVENEDEESPFKPLRLVFIKVQALWSISQHAFCLHSNSDPQVTPPRDQHA